MRIALFERRHSRASFGSYIALLVGHMICFNDKSRQNVRLDDKTRDCFENHEEDRISMDKKLMARDDI